MVTIREALLSVVGESAASIQPIVEALAELGFDEHEQVGTAFSLLEADQAAGLTVRQQLTLKAAIQAVAVDLGARSATRAVSESELITGSITYSFTSARDFLRNYEPRRLELLPSASSQTMGVKCQVPSAVEPWHTFDTDCWALLRVLPEGGPPVKVAVRAPKFATVSNENNLQFELLTHLLQPLELALTETDDFFQALSPAPGVKKGMTSARSDFVLQSRANNELLVAIEVKTSAVFCVPKGSNLPDMYAAAVKDTKNSKNNNIVKCVSQLFSYLDVVPFGVVVTDQQLFCMRREGTVLLCSPSIPLAGYVLCLAKRGRGHPRAAELQEASSAATAARKELEASGGRSADSLTAVAALYSLAKMSQRWWTQQPSGGVGQHSNSSDGGGGTAASKPATLLPTDAESECTSSQLFPGRSFDPRVPGGVPPSLGSACLGVVLQGAVGGRAAAVKLVDLWRGPEGKEALQHEARIYQLLRPVQGTHVPELLGFGTCDGWQYFLATSLEGPALSSEEGWALGEEVTCAAAFAALDAVHRCGVLHGDIALRNFVLAAPPAGGGGGKQDWRSGSQEASSGQQAQRQPLVLLLDFGLAQSVAEAAEEQGEEPAELIGRERMELRDLLDWEPPSSLLPLAAAASGTYASSGAGAAAALGGGGGDRPQLQPPGLPSPGEAPGRSAAASRPGSPAGSDGAGPLSAFLPPRPLQPRPHGRPGGWRQQQQGFARPRTSLAPRVDGGFRASRLSLRRLT
ncbi:hypothetical protein CHLRE_04g229050v5 [Chlamydomonas reinhardtii]|uniref:Protein kinase domain-containing protein n=1 Tax=Chlamydomonas reinhardtii TaxID=3055 RepID=A0A2K3DUV4_CHLRE|nr:uncharacterized protein CHLRE_04g229050v5 [Chlamydomonas reinhardtii]PNW84306.1 hypothetical protein CHLRE_04g229050v5 [Chlamydomonas reinhardtii]